MNQLRLSLLLIAVAATLAAWSFPTMYGDTGLVLAPTADIQPEATFEFTATYASEKSAAGTTTIFPLSLVYGIASGTELFFTYGEAREGVKGFNMAGAGAKLSLITEDMGSDVKLPAVSVGVRGFQQRSVVNGTLNGVDAYAVVSKTLLMSGDMVDTGFALRGHVGVEYASYTDALQGSFVKPFGGISFNLVGYSALALDYLPELKKDNVVFRRNTVSIAIRRQLSPNFWLNVGATRTYGQGETSAFAGIMYRFSERNTHGSRDPESF